MEQIEIGLMINVTQIKKAWFREKYGVSPKFVKVPVGFENMIACPDVMRNGEECTHFFGMLMCESPTVECPMDIEVF